MKLFKNKKTGKMYVTLSEEKDCLVGFDGVPYTGSSDDVEEVSTTASAQDFRRLREEANGFSIGFIQFICFRKVRKHAFYFNSR